jgi:outer membrane protein OmpA-like peptidoglycan-associated protein
VSTGACACISTGSGSSTPTSSICRRSQGRLPHGANRESGPGFIQIITSTGRHVTHGLYFDTGSERLKAESAGVIRLVATGLQKNPNLKLRIEDHTDSTGTKPIGSNDTPDGRAQNRQVEFVR